MTGKMSKAERSELGSLIRKREKVMKAAAAERSSALMAEFETQAAQIYSFNDDDVWKAATEAAAVVVTQAQEKIAERCRELGIPAEFAPGISFGWHGRGSGAVGQRQAELRRKAKSKIELIEKEAITKIERLSLAAQTEVIANGLESAAAREFLEQMPSLEKLMPSIDIAEVKALVDARPVSGGRDW